MQPVWHIELLGSLQAKSESSTLLRFRTRRVGSLLAYLALFQGRSHSREELAYLLWPDVDEEVSRRNLRQALSSLRHHLEPPPLPAGSVLMVKQSSVRLNLETVSTDVAEFERLLNKGARAGTSDGRVTALASAIELYKGSLLPGHYEDWAQTERQRLEDSYVFALKSLVELAQKDGEVDSAITYIRLTLDKEALNEELHTTLIRLYLHSNRPAAALKQFRDLQRILKSELNSQPGAEARELALRAKAEGGGARQAIESASTDAKVAKIEPTRAPIEEQARRVRLPVQLTKFHGRIRDLGLALDRIVTHGDRLVSLVGPAGVGKTRLSIEVARRLADEWDWNAWFVPLADISDGAMVLDAVADVVAPRSANQQDPVDRVRKSLKSGRNLIVLDNLEHIVEAAAQGVQALLRELPNVTLLTSTRQALRVEGDHEIGIEPLPVPREKVESRIQAGPDLLAEIATYPSVQLFVDRCQAFLPDYQLTANNCQTICAICERLEGLPLALEIAAGLSNAFSASQLLQNLENRLDILKNRRRDASPRHRSLRAAIEYSYDLLSPELQRFFTSLSVFRGGFSVSAADEVCMGELCSEGETKAAKRRRRERCLRAILDLQERSLVHADDGHEGSEARFRFLESYREFGREQLSEEEEEALQDRHADYFLGAATRAVNQTGQSDAEFVILMQTDRDNLITAIQTFAERGHLEPAIRLLHFAIFNGRSGRTRRIEVNIAERLLQHSNLAQVEPEDRITLYRIAANKNLFEGDYAAAEACCNKALEEALASGSDKLVATSYASLAVVAGYLGDQRKALELNLKTLAHAEAAHDLELAEKAYLGIGTIHWTACDLDAAEKAFLNAKAACTNHLDRSYWLVLYNLARVNLDKGRLDEGMQVAAESLRCAKRISDLFGISMNLSMIARYHWLKGNLRAAFSSSYEALVKRQDYGFSYWILNAIQFHGFLLLDAGLAKEAAVLIAASKTTLHADRELDRNEFGTAISKLESTLPEEEFQSAWAHGLSMNTDDAFAYATAILSIPQALGTQKVR